MCKYLYKRCILFYFSGKFDNNGVAEGYVEENVGRVKVLRLTVHTESDNWAILSEVSHMYIYLPLSFPIITIISCNDDYFL